MPVFTILFGIALMLVGIGTYAASDNPTLSGLLPALFGLIALTLGVGSIIKKDLRHHFMHGAVLLATLGVLIPLIRLFIYLADMGRDEQMQLVRVILTVTISGAYVYTAIQSFRAARLNRKGDKDVAAPPPPAPQAPEPPAEPTQDD